MLAGGCYCGAVRYETRGEPIERALCHCSICRATTGAPAVVGAWPPGVGQVRCAHDMRGRGRGRKPRFVKEFAHLGGEVMAAAKRYAAEVEAGTFPDAEHSYSGGLSVVGDGVGYGGR